MRRGVSGLVVLAILAALSMSVAAQFELPGLILTDLQLISQESLPHWTPRWTGPIQAATIAAWFAEHGYPALMQDYNGDGVIDELDTIELADEFGLEPMRADSTRGTTDVLLVVGLANYIAARYPDEFVLKIYDAGFPQEFQAQGFGPFAPDAIPGIVLELKGEPSIEAYVHELSTGEGVIAGIEEEHDVNRYLCGRSFLYELTSAGYKPVDFAWAKEDQWEPGHQGQVLETVARMEHGFEIEFLNQWLPVEFMLALSPAIEREPQTEEHTCPDNAIAYDVSTTTLSRYGDVQIEECVIREGELDIYVWTVTNVSFEQNGCGLCFFRIPNPGYPSVLHSELPPWTFISAWGSWIWWLPSGTCGLTAGNSAVFMVAVPAPSVDTAVIGNVGGCATAQEDVLSLYRVTTTGPGEPNGECPDLAVRILDESCVYNGLTGMYDFMVWLDVVNVGTAPVTTSFDVSLTGISHPGSDVETVAVPPVLLPGDIASLTLSFTTPPDATGGPPCPLTYEVMADSGGAIAECSEDNNVVTSDICCLGEPDEGEDCPDLIVAIDDISCELDREHKQYVLTVDATVTNIGTATVTDAIYVRATCDRGSDTDVILTDLDPGDTAAAQMEITFSVNEPGCPIPVTVTVDYTDFVDECDEDNNTDTDDACCD